MKSTTYDKLKFTSMFLGYLAAFVVSLSDIWGFKYGSAVAATITALGVLLGSVLKISSDKYYAGLDDGGVEAEIEDMSSQIEAMIEEANGDGE